MKKLFFLIAALCCLFYTGIAQSPKSTVCETIFVNFIPCMDEPVDGETLHCITTWTNGKTQETMKGTYVGLETGKIYTLSFALNSGAKFPVNLQDAGTWRVIATGSIECEGSVVANFHVTMHGTWPMDKEDWANLMTKGEWDYECY